MSIDALNWVFEEVRGLSHAERLVLIVLANYADEAGSCYPSTKSIAERTDLKPGSVTANIRKLEARGLLVREQQYRPNGAKSSNRYTLQISCGAPPVTEGVGTPHRTGGGTPHRTGGAFLNHQSNHQKEKKEGVPIPPELQNTDFVEKWTEWLDYRKRTKRKAVSDRAAALQLKKLAAVGVKRAIATIERSIENDWQGLFPEKEEVEQQRKKRTVDDGPKRRYEGFGAGAWRPAFK